MAWKRAIYKSVNGVLRRTVGYELQRPPGHRSWRLPPPRAGRLLVAPVFIFCAARSGSTLLRAIVGSHSELYAPPEVPLAHLHVRVETRWIQASMDALKLTRDDLEHMLWDHVLADALARSGKRTIVVKTPSNALIWQRIAACWPDGRYVFLLRHPVAAVMSLHASWDPTWHPGESGSLASAMSKGLRTMSSVEEARRALPGVTVRYEDLTADPERTMRELCDFLGVPYEPAMLDYGRFAHNHFAPGLGDASHKIRSGRIHRAVAPQQPAEVPAALKELCISWGYRDTEPEPASRPQGG